MFFFLSVGRLTGKGRSAWGGHSHFAAARRWGCRFSPVNNTLIRQQCRGGGVKKDNIYARHAQFLWIEYLTGEREKCSSLKRSAIYSIHSRWICATENFPGCCPTILYKSLFTKLVAAKKNIHTYKYGEKQQNKTKYSEQVCHSVVVCGNAIADTSLLC